MRFNDAVTGLALIVLAAFIAWQTRSFPAMPGQKYGPDLFPLLIAAGLGGGGLFLVAQGLRSRRPAVVLGRWAASPWLFANLLSVPAALLFYILASDALGFLPSATALLCALICLLRRGHVLSSLAVAVIASLAIYFAFSRLLLVPLPRGPIEQLIG